MPKDCNVEKLTPDLRRLLDHFAELDDQLRALGQERDEVKATIEAQAAEAGIMRPRDEGGFCYQDTYPVVPKEPAYDTAVCALLRERNLLQCISMRPKPAEITKALQAGKLADADVAKFRREREPYITRRPPKAEVEEGAGEGAN